MIKQAIPLIVLMNAASVAMADPMAIKQEVKPIIQSFAKNLQSQLMQAVQSGGPVAGIQVCNLEAPRLAEQHSQSDWQVARTSLKYRNSENAPDAWETEQLQMFDQQVQDGKDPKQMWAIQEDAKQIRVMKAIPAKGICLTCHGQQITPAVSAKLDELYPNDLATGYELGQIRGAFSLTKTKR